jgi:hypothetical protein
MRNRLAGRSLSDYFWAGQSLGKRQSSNLFISTSLALGNAIIFFAWLGYSVGFAALWLQVAWCACFWIVGKYAGRIRELASRGTLHGNIAKVASPEAGALAAVATTIGFSLNLGWELVAGVSVFQILIGDSFSYALIIIALLASVAVGYSILGGLRGNAAANEVQNWFSYAALLLLCGYLMFGMQSNGSQGWQNIGADKLNPFSLQLLLVLGIGGFVTNIVYSVIWQFVDMSAWQNIAASDTNEDAKKSLRISAVAIFFFPGFFAMLAGMLLRTSPDVTSDNIVTIMLQEISKDPIVFLVVVAGFIAAMLSTIDGFLLAASQALTWDIWTRREVDTILQSARTDETAHMERSIVHRAQLLMPLIAIAGAGSVFLLNKFWGLPLFEVVYVAYSAQLSLLPTVLAILFGKKISKSAGLLSISIGISIAYIGTAVGLAFKEETIGRLLTGQDLLTWSPMIGLALAFACLGDVWRSAKW